MAIEYHEEDGNVVSIKMSGKLTKEDYKHFVPKLEDRIAECGKIRVRFQMHDFHGWEMGAAWEDLKFDVRHFSDIERLAMIGETQWQEWMAKFCRPFTKAKIQYFTGDQLDEADQWIRAD